MGGAGTIYVSGCAPVLDVLADNAFGALAKLLVHDSPTDECPPLLTVKELPAAATAVSGNIVLRTVCPEGDAACEVVSGCDIAGDGCLEGLFADWSSFDQARMWMMAGPRLWEQLPCTLVGRVPTQEDAVPQVDHYNESRTPNVSIGADEQDTCAE
jgi:hypothetical protein